MNLQDIINDPEPTAPEVIQTLLPLLDEIDIEKAQVMHVLKNTRAAYEDMNVFENAVLVINGISPDVEKVEGCEPKYIWKAISVIRSLHPKLEFAHEVLMYIRFIFQEHGYSFFPPKTGLDEYQHNMFEEIQDRAASYASEEKGLPELEDNNEFDIQVTKYLIIKEYMNRSNR